MTHYRIALDSLTVLDRDGVPSALFGLPGTVLANPGAFIDPCPPAFGGVGFWPVSFEVPTFDPATQRLSDQVDELLDADARTVTVRPLVVNMTPDEVAAAAEAAKPPVPVQVTNFQARAVLLAAGLFDRVDAAIKAQPQTSAAYQAWEYANDITRNGTLVNSMAETLGFSAAQLDDLFRQAATIEA
jgi:hypothetical protein